MLIEWLQVIFPNLFYEKISKNFKKSKLSVKQYIYNIVYVSNSLAGIKYTCTSTNYPTRVNSHRTTRVASEDFRVTKPGF